MRKLRKLVLTTAALAALAIGGAAFANAQNAAVATQVPTKQSAVDVPEPGDTPDAAQAGGQSDVTDQSDVSDAPEPGDVPDAAVAGSHDTETND